LEANTTQTALLEGIKDGNLNVNTSAISGNNLIYDGETGKF
jgi:hypothetical protein